MESSSKKLVSQSIKTLDSILIDEKLPPSERATVALKILEMARTFAPETPPASETQPIPIRKLNFTAPKIFLHLAAYRDSELIPTLKDALKKAHRPEKITFGIVWQFIPGEDENITGKMQEFPCKMIEIDARQSLGVCWARSMGQRLLHDEDFILQLDSHHRFVEGWDSLLLKQLAQCPSPKPILSAYTPPYIPPDEIPPGYPSTRLTAHHFDDHGILSFVAGESLASYSEPQLGMFLAGGFIFAPRQFYLEVPYDPFLYFRGEEITLSTRAWTKGWDIFYPHQITIYHYYTRTNAKKHWDVDSEWFKLEQKSRERVKKILRISPLEAESLEIYDIGNIRTLEDYQNFCGVNFQTQEISETASKGIPTKSLLFQKLE
ncbi:[Skp1-protein]-hydroxyproline N-acetylglucosaminyltransferase [Planktothrix rubescens]|nr:[Skp1-protein]-hydroxyproline N-acetylglucosaminyltransferase [Planktothrix rubescens]